jgi:hypothetical protein
VEKELGTKVMKKEWERSFDIGDEIFARLWAAQSALLATALEFLAGRYPANPPSSGHSLAIAKTQGKVRVLVLSRSIFPNL